MSLNKDIFFSKINKLSCFENNPHFAVGVSGGPDSMALVYLLNTWLKEKKGKLTALIFDHGIRNNSREEANEVKNILKEMEVNSFIIKAQKYKTIKKNMAQARDNRFEGLINYCKNNNILHLFLGHHFDDNLETYLIRKLNGSNLEGLGSISLINYFYKIQILRPLLNINKQSIINFNKNNNIKFLKDPSNDDIKFTRVKVRNFLKNKLNYNLVMSDFNSLKKQIPNYKKMIWELFIKNLIKVNDTKVRIGFDGLMGIDELIIEKHILIILKFFSENKYQTKSSKIKFFIAAIKKSDFKIYNLSGIIIEKDRDSLIFSKK